MKGFIFLLFLSGQVFAASPYYEVRNSTDVGTSSMTISGYIGVAASSTTPTDFQITINGVDGYIQFPDGTQQTTAATAVSYAVLNATQTFSGENTFSGTTSTTTFSGWVDIGLEQVSNATSGTTTTVACPAGKRVISCGCYTDTNSIKFCRPMYAFDSTETCQITTTTSENIGVTAICARIK